MTPAQAPAGVDEALGPLEVVHRLLAALHAGSPDGFYQEAVDAVVATLGVDRASLLLFDCDGIMRFMAWRGLSDEYRRAVEGHTPWTPGDTAARPILVPDVAADPDLAPFLRAAALAGALASRAATAIDNARLFRDRTAIAQHLQASLLPPHLPEIPGVELGSRYAAAGAGIEVGGDFYDVFPLDARRFVVVLGDVCGRGIKAATLATLARYTIRSAAVAVVEPAAILEHVNKVLLGRQDPKDYEPQFCTAMVAVAERVAEGIAVELAVAGHPLPLHLTTDGSVAPVGVPGSLIGVADDASATATSLVLRPGEALVCVTDGVLERRHGSSFFGETGLAATVSKAAAGDANELAAAIEAATLQFSPEETTDDFAVLVLRAPTP